MTKNPIINALSAALYIAGVVSILFFSSQFGGGQQETILIPITLLSLFSLSAAVMAFIFFYKPVTMYVEGEKKAAVKLLVQTIGAFACVTALFFVAFLLQFFL